MEKRYKWVDGATLEPHSHRKHKILREYISNGIVRLTGSDPKNLQLRALRLQVDATRPGRRLGFV